MMNPVADPDGTTINHSGRVKDLRREMARQHEEKPRAESWFLGGEKKVLELMPEGARPHK